MTLEALSILIYALLIFGAVAVQATYAALTAGLAFGFSNRDGAQPGMGPAGLRIDKTLGNLKEGATMYLPLALLAVSLDISNAWTWGAALVTIVSRLIYAPVFYLGIPVMRTLVWGPSFAAIPAIAFGIIVGTP
jgi:uncharacterized MAPEG superfamily protein